MRQFRPADMREIYDLRAKTIDYFYTERKEEIELWSDIMEDYGNEILHLMCGTGELSLGLAEKGFNIVGLDLTESMISEANDKLENRELDNIKFVNDDARHFNLKRRFDFIFASNGDFHHFTERKEIDSVLAKSYAHLKNGGAIALELFELPEEDYHRKEKEFDPLRAPPQGMDMWKTNEVSYYSNKKIMEVREKLHVEDEENDETTNAEYEILLKLFSEEEIKKILQKNGFDNIKFIKDYSVPTHIKNPDTWIVTAEK
ncbi:MAG: class I SAM-dependent methyltransferase [Thermoplasmata archaeon]